MGELSTWFRVAVAYGVFAREITARKTTTRLCEQSSTPGQVITVYQDNLVLGADR
jgi:hypothetical protein